MQLYTIHFRTSSWMEKNVQCLLTADLHGSHLQVECKVTSIGQSDIMIRETFMNKSEWCSRSMLGLFSKPVQEFRSDDVRCIVKIRPIFVIKVN